MRRKLHDTRITIWDLYNRYSKNKLILPDWQREFVWDKQREEGWYNDLDDMCFSKMDKDHDIPGVLMTFSVKGEEGVKYLNDGGNRTLCTTRYIQHKLKDGVTRNIVEEAMSHVYVSLQEWEYTQANFAFLDFIRANQGVLGTPKEIGQGILATKLPDYKTYWKSFFLKLENAVNCRLHRMGCKLPNGASKRTAIHKNIRDNYGMFVRFVSKDKARSKYDSGVTGIRVEIQDNDLKPNQSVECKLVNAIKNMSFDEVEREFDKFCNFLDCEVALYQKVWNDIFKDGHSLSPSPTHLRWVFHLAIWRKNNGIQVDKYVQFLSNLISRTQGKTAVYDLPNKTGNRLKAHANLGLSNLGILTQVERLLDVENIFDIPKRRRTIYNTSSGYDESHIVPFATNGNGDTFSEPSVLNKSRGPNPVLVD